MDLKICVKNRDANADAARADKCIYTHNTHTLLWYKRVKKQFFLTRRQTFSICLYTYYDHYYYYYRRRDVWARHSIIIVQNEYTFFY